MRSRGLVGDHTGDRNRREIACIERRWQRDEEVPFSFPSLWIEVDKDETYGSGLTAAKYFTTTG